MPWLGRQEASGVIAPTCTKSELHSAGSAESYDTSYDDVDDTDEPTAPKFEPPSAEPQPETSQAASAETSEAESKPT